MTDDIWKAVYKGLLECVNFQKWSTICKCLLYSDFHSPPNIIMKSNMCFRISIQRIFGKHDTGIGYFHRCPNFCEINLSPFVCIAVTARPKLYMGMDFFQCLILFATVITFKG